MTNAPTVRVSIMRCDATVFASARRAMDESQELLVPAIRQLSGLLEYYAGSDEATLSLTNVSLWNSLDEAKQMETLEPMLELARRFTAMGGITFERPIMNYQTIWSVDPSGS